MATPTRSGSGSSYFRKLGRFVYRRRKLILVAWLIALGVVLPIMTNVGKVTSLVVGTATGSGLESVKASNLISAEFT